MLVSKKNDKLATYNKKEIKIYKISKSLELLETKEFLGIQHLHLGNNLYFSRHNELYCDMKLIRKFNSEILFLSENCIGCEDGQVVIGDLEFIHSYGVIGIALGDYIYILDIRGKLLIYDKKNTIGSYDKLNMPMIFDEYLFICDNNFLFCKTKQAFAMFVEFSNEILDFFIFKNLIAIQTGNKILIVEINSKSVVLEIKCFGKFVIDENYNRLIVFENEKVEFYDIPEIKERGKILFEEDRIFEKKIYEQKIENDSQPVIKNYQRKENIKNLFEKSDNSELKNLFEEKKFDEKKYNHNFGDKKYDPNFDHNFDDENLDDSEESNLESFKKSTSSVFMPSMIVKDDVTLMAYNKEGYLIMKSQDEFNFVEAIYHDKSHVGRKIQDFTKSKIGSIGSKGFLITNGESLNFYGKNDWFLKSEEKISLIGIGDIIATVKSDILEIYSISGKLISKFLIPSSIKTLIIENSNIFLFCVDKIIKIKKINQNFHLENFYFLNKNFNFCAVENENIYFGDSKIFKLENGLFKEIIKVKGNPLCIFNDYVVSLTGRIIPEPVIEYFKIVDEIVLDDEFDESFESDQELPTHFRNENVLKTKKFDPRSF